MMLLYRHHLLALTSQWIIKIRQANAGSLAIHCQGVQILNQLGTKQHLAFDSLN